MPDPCVFCGGKATREHVMPKWLRRRLGDAVTNDRLKSTVEYGPPDPTTGVQPATETNRILQGSVYTMRPWIACQSCNGGWMKAIEDRTLPILEPLINGEPRRINEDDARTLATWAAKTNITFEFLDVQGTTRAVPAAHRTWLMERNEPPPNTRVYIGLNPQVSTSVLHSAFTVGHHSDHEAAIRDGVAYRANTFLTWFGIGRVILVVSGTTEPAIAAIGPRNRRRFLPLWPPVQVIDWPPPESTDPAVHFQIAKAGYSRAIKRVLDI